MKRPELNEPVDNFSEEKDSLEALNRAQRRSYGRYQSQQRRKQDILHARQMKKVQKRIISKTNRRKQ